MLNEGANNISIKIYLANKYPDKTHYIMKMIKHHANNSKTKEVKRPEYNDGEER